jgi:deoxyribose-phosphate aldolase
MVADLAAIIEGDSKYLADQLAMVLKVCQSMRPAVVLKVIIESAALNNEENIRLPDSPAGRRGLHKNQYRITPGRRGDD